MICHDDEEGLEQKAPGYSMRPQISYQRRAQLRTYVLSLGGPKGYDVDYHGLPAERQESEEGPPPCEEPAAEVYVQEHPV